MLLSPLLCGWHEPPRPLVPVVSDCKWGWWPEPGPSPTSPVARGGCTQNMVAVTALWLGSWLQAGLAFPRPEAQTHAPSSSSSSKTCAGRARALSMSPRALPTPPFPMDAGPWDTHSSTVKHTRRRRRPRARCSSRAARPRKGVVDLSLQVKAKPASRGLSSGRRSACQCR